MTTTATAVAHPRERNARHSPDSADETAGEETLAAHAKRSLRNNIKAMVTAALDAGIATLKALRTRIGGAVADDDGDRPRSREDRSGGRRDRVEAAAAIAEPAPPPKRRRLRAFLVFCCVVVAGGMGGGALSYNLLTVLLERDSAQIRSTEAAMAKNLKAMAANEKKLDAAQAGRDEAEKKLEALRAEYSTFATEAQKRLSEAEQQLAPILAAEAAERGRQQAARLVARNGGKQEPNTGDCSLVGGNVAALKDCVDKFNR